jgi:signal peptidase I
MSKKCPNCLRMTDAPDCPWCGFPVDSSVAGQSGNDTPEPDLPLSPAGKALKGTGWAVSGILAVLVLFFVFINFSADYNLRVVLSESMTPTLKLGDMVLTGPPNGPFSDDIAPDSVITYHLGKELVTHRVIAIEGENLVTQGDAVEEPDPWPVALSDVDGILILTIPKVGWAINFVRSSKTGWFLVVILPAVVLVGLFAREIVKESLKP